MTQVSRRYVNKEIHERMSEIFRQTIIHLKNPRQAQDFFDDFLTPTEKIMFAKRLSIGLMLLKGYDYRSIQSTLKVSSTTIKAVNLWIKHGGKEAKNLLQRIIQSEKTEEFWDKIGNTIAEILPPPRGTDWKSERSMHYQKKRERQWKRDIL